MKKINAIVGVFAALAVVPMLACSSSAGGPTTTTGGTTDPAPTAAADDTTMPPGDPGTTPTPDPVTKSCACPSHCADTVNPKKLVCTPAAPPATLPGSQKIGSFMISGYEYWQWKKPDPYAGGNEVAWGYNGDGEPKNGVKPTDPSRACMAASRAVLVDILTNNPPAELEALRAAKGVKNFWNWNNDLTDAAASKVISKQYDGLWLYEGARSDGGLIKWISATERDGKCRLPNRDDVIAFATACAKSFPNCGSGK